MGCLSSSDLSAVKGSMPFFRRSLEKMHSTRKCPLCTRGFDDNASFEKTIKSVRCTCIYIYYVFECL